MDCVRRWVGRRFWGELWAMWAGMGMGMGGDGGQRRLGLVPVRACILGPGARARWGGGKGEDGQRPETCPGRPCHDGGLMC